MSIDVKCRNCGDVFTIKPSRLNTARFCSSACYDKSGSKNPNYGSQALVVPVAERFWKFVDKRGSQECWPWLGSRDQHGYGRISINRRPVPAHRVAWELTYEQTVPTGLDACHRCDNPTCVNPAHVFVGTRADNMKDCSAKGRAYRRQGEAHPSAKLTAEQVRTIRAEYVPYKVPKSTFAKRYGVSEGLIQCILARRQWRHVA